MQSDIKIYVATHKKYIPVTGRAYCPIHVGAILSNDDLGYLRDDTGTHISSQNLQYCELTGQYWAWKNDNGSEISGLCHYRRYFVNDYCSKKGFIEDILDETDINHILEEYDVILPEPAYKVKENAILYRGKKRKFSHETMLLLEMTNSIWV